MGIDEVLWSCGQASGAGFTLRLSDYTDRFRLSSTSGTHALTADIIVVNSTLLDLDAGRQFYSFLVGIHCCTAQLMLNSSKP